MLVFNFSWRHKVVPSYRRIVEADAEKLGKRINVAVDALAFVVRVDLVSVETRTEELTRKSRWRVVLARLSLYPRISGCLSSEIRIHLTYLLAILITAAEGVTCVRSHIAKAGIERSIG